MGINLKKTFNASLACFWRHHVPNGLGGAVIRERGTLPRHVCPFSCRGAYSDNKVDQTAGIYTRSTFHQSSHQ